MRSAARVSLSKLRSTMQRPERQVRKRTLEARRRRQTAALRPGQAPGRTAARAFPGRPGYWDGTQWHAVTRLRIGPLLRQYASPGRRAVLRGEVARHRPVAMCIGDGRDDRCRQQRADAGDLNQSATSSVSLALARTIRSFSRICFFTTLSCASSMRAKPRLSWYPGVVLVVVDCEKWFDPFRPIGPHALA